jgi:hypothetical protein
MPDRFERTPSGPPWRDAPREPVGWVAATVASGFRTATRRAAEPGSDHDRMGGPVSSPSTFVESRLVALVVQARVDNGAMWLTPTR